MVVGPMLPVDQTQSERKCSYIYNVLPEGKIKHILTNL